MVARLQIALTLEFHADSLRLPEVKKFLMQLRRNRREAAYRLLLRFLPTFSGKPRECIVKLKLSQSPAQSRQIASPFAPHNTKDYNTCMHIVRMSIKTAFAL